MAKVSELNSVDSTTLSDDHYILVSDEDKLRKITTSEFIKKVSTTTSEEVVSNVVTTRWNSFPSDCELISIVDDKIDNIVNDESGPMNIINPEDAVSIIKAMYVFMECIDSDTRDQGQLIDELREYVRSLDYKTKLFIDESETEEEINSKYELTKEYLINIIDKFRNSPDHGYITTTIKTSSGLAKLTKENNPSMELVANGLVFIISRFSLKEVVIVSYASEIDGGGAII